MIYLFAMTYLFLIIVVQNYLSIYLNLILFLLVMQRKTTSKVLSYLGAAVRSGQGLGGVELGPDAVRNCGVFNLLRNQYKVRVEDYGNIHQIFSQVHNDLHYNGAHQSEFKNLQILDPTLESLNKKIEEILKNEPDDHVLMTVGGDHSIATGTIHGVLSKYENIKVIWVDAHADILDADTTNYTGYHGTPLAHVLGVNDNSKRLKGFDWMKRRLKRENVVHIGWRQINEGQLKTMKDYNIKYFTPDHIDMYGIGEVMNQTLKYLDPHQDPNTVFHISFDIDALDPAFAFGTGTTVRGGLTPREAMHIVRRTVFEKKLVSMDLVQINPSLEQNKRKGLWADGYYNDQMGETVGVGADLIESLYFRGLQ